MKIIETKSRLQLDPPKFSCDKPLCNRDIDPFENRSFFTVFVGQPRSGKTSHMISALLSKRVYNRVFDHIYVFMPTNSRKSLKKNPFRNLKAGNLYDSLNSTDLQEVLKQIAKDRKEWEDDDDEDKSSTPPNNLILLDDMAVFLKNNAVAQLLTYIILNRRHLRVSVLLTTQYFNSIPLPIRKNISSIVLANKPVNNKELTSITEELFSMDQKDSISVLKYCFQKPYDKFHCILEPLQYYRNLNKLEISGTELF